MASQKQITKRDGRIENSGHGDADQHDDGPGGAHPPRRRRDQQRRG